MAERGRPTKYRPEYAEQAIRQIGDEGQSITQFARNLRVARQTIYQWAEDHPEFYDALTCARDWSEAYWEDRMREFMTSRDANAPLIKLYLANRFKWTDKVEQEDDNSTNLASALDKLADKLPG